TIASSQGDFAVQAAANFALGRAYHVLGAYRRATERLNRNVASLQGERMYGRFGTAGVTSVLSIMALAWCHAELGSFAEGIARGEEALRIAQARDDKLSLMFADLAVGQLYLRQGDLVRAVPRLERGLATCRTWDFPSWLPWLASRVGAAYTLRRLLTRPWTTLDGRSPSPTSWGCGPWSLTATSASVSCVGARASEKRRRSI